MDRRRMTTRIFGFSATVAALLVLAATSPVQADSSGQVVQGSVYTSTFEDCSVVHGTLEWAGRLGHASAFTFDVKPSTRGHRFLLRTTGPSAADLDIHFTGSRYFTDFRSRTLGGEHGNIPRYARQAVICMWAGTPTNFVYTARGT